MHKCHILQDEFAMMSLEMDKMKCQNQEERKKYLEVIDIFRDKYDDLQRTIKLNEETLTKTTFRYNEQIDILKTEITKLNIKLENKEQNTERQETESESYLASQAAAPHPCDESQTSNRELELPSQTARDGCLGLKGKGNFKISKRNLRSEILSPKFSKPGIKTSSREKVFYTHMMRDIRKICVVLKRVQRDLKQTQCQVNEMKHRHQNEPSQNYKCIENQEAMGERLSQMESEITLLRQQFHEGCNKCIDKELLVYIQEQCNIMKAIQDEAENSSLRQENRSMELMNENHHFEERLNQYKKEESEREVSIK